MFFRYRAYRILAMIVKLAGKSFCRSCSAVIQLTFKIHELLTDFTDSQLPLLMSYSVYTVKCTYRTWEMLLFSIALILIKNWCPDFNGFQAYAWKWWQRMHLTRAIVITQTIVQWKAHVMENQTFLQYKAIQFHSSSAKGLFGITGDTN